MELDDDYIDNMLEKADTLNKEAKEDRCILDLDSPSYPPELDEYRQCGCTFCIEIYRRGGLLNKLSENKK
jgi:hypothetical protein